MGGPQQGDDLRLDLEIDFMTAVFGGEEKIRISHLETCDTCTGSGIKPGTKPRTCGTCSGSGVVMQVVRTPLGMLQQQSACPQCQGTGEIVDEYCGTCSGRGRVQKTKQLKITVPALWTMAAGCVSGRKVMRGQRRVLPGICTSS